MARQILTNTNFNQNELQNARIQNLASAPSDPVEGQIYYDTALDKLRVYNALLADWVNLDGSNIPDSTITSAKIVDGTIVNADINASAGIVYSKLTLTGSIVNADIASGAAIAKSKLANLDIVNSDVNASAAIAYSKLNLSGGIVNADINASAAIGYSKLNLTGGIVNGDIAAGAAIALSKLATDPLARANHTGTQPASTISDFTTVATEIAQDAIGTIVGAGGLVVTYDDAGTGLTTITLTNNEAMQDAIGPFFASTTGSSGITVTYDDINGRMNYVVTDSPLLQGQNGAYYLARGNHTGTQTAATISDFNSVATEIAQDAVGALVGAGGIVVTYDDAGTGLTTLTLTNNEAFQDVVGAFLASGAGSSGITVTYDDAGGDMNYVVNDSPLLGGQNGAYYLSRANHTGTQAAATISDFNTAVRTNRLDQLAVPTASVDLNSQKIINLADPTNPQDAATKNYVDLARQGIRQKEAVRVSTTGAITLSGDQTIDGVDLDDGDRVLVKNQASAAANGIYIVNTAGGWTRATDADTAAELADGATVWVSQGTTLANTTWSQINTLNTLGTDPQTWVQQGAATNFTEGPGIDITGDTISVVAGNGIIADATSTRVDPAVVARKSTGLIGDNSATSIDYTHNLGNQWCTVQVYQAGSPFAQVECDIELKNTTQVTLRFAVAPTTNQYRVVVTG